MTAESTDRDDYRRTDEPVQIPESEADYFAGGHEATAAVQRAVKGAPIGDMHGEKVTWRGHGWTVADVQNDGQHVHLTLTNPRPEPWSNRTTNDG